jgi:hypothetical protein
MKVRNILALLCVFTGVKLYAADINITLLPVVSYNEGKVSDEFKDFHHELTAELQKMSFDGLVFFSDLRSVDGQVMSTMDAAEICNKNNLEFVIFGFISKNGENISGQLKLYDANKRKIIENFYGSDSETEMTRLVLTFKEHICDYIKERTGVEPLPKTKEYAKWGFYFPLTVGYWTFYNGVWPAAFDEIIRAKTGVDFRPAISISAFRNKEIFFTLGVEAAFQYAMGNENYYPANLYTIEILIPINVCLNFSKNNNMNLGLGPAYEFEILQITKKYENSSTLTDNRLGLYLQCAYSYKVSKIISLNAGTESTLFFYKDSPSWVSFNIGMSFNIEK